MSDFIKLWNAVAWVSKEQQAKRSAQQAAQPGAQPKASSDSESDRSEGEKQAYVQKASSPTPASEIEEGKSNAEGVRGSEAAQETTEDSQDEKEDPVNVDLRQHAAPTEEDKVTDSAPAKELWHASLTKMEEMGFKDEGGWLSQLLQTKGGNMDEALKTLEAVESALRSTAAQ